MNDVTIIICVAMICFTAIVIYGMKIGSVNAALKLEQNKKLPFDPERN